MYAEKCFINGKFYTMEKEGEFFEAIAVRDNKIVAVGSNADIEKMKSDQTIDLEGKTVLPGLTDSHIHILAYGKTLKTVALRGTRSVEEVKDKLREKAKSTPKGEWIVGIGFDHENFDEKRIPNRYDLDDVSNEHPIFIVRYCLHVRVANSLALELGGIDRNYETEAPDLMKVDENGEPNGILWETAALPIMNMLPDPVATHEDKKNAVESVCKELISYGVTSAHTVQGKFVGAEEYMNVYQDLEAEGRLPVRMYVAFDEFPSFSMRTGFGNEKIKYGFYKIYMDGSLGSRGAAIYEPYCDSPGENGFLLHSREEMEALVQKAYEQDIQLGIHSIGDRSAEIIISAMEKAYHANPKKDVRFRLIHALLLNADLIERMGKLGVIAEAQPIFVATNMSWTEDRIGPERTRYAYAWKKLIDAGVVVTGSSDAPVQGVNPFPAIYASATRLNLDGYPEGGWYSENKVSVYEAVCMYTINGAYCSFEEDIKGTIAVGKLADLAVIDKDIFEIDPKEIKDIKVLQTYLGGERVY